MSYQHHDTGKKGEDLAIDYLQKQGFTILLRNWRYRRYEMDIIAEKSNVLHFIEVKTRSNDLFGYPEEIVSKRKNKDDAAHRSGFSISKSSVAGGAV